MSTGGTMTAANLTAYVHCQDCGKEFPRKASRCTACNAPNRPPKRVPGQTTFCYQCGLMLPKRSNICEGCGFAHP